MIMKKIFLILISSLLFSNVYAQANINYNTCIDGYWGNWEGTYGYEMKGTYSNFIVYSTSDHPSNYVLKVEISYIDFSQKKGDGHYEGVANVEYVTNASVPNLDTYVKKFPHIYNDYGRKINKVKATIYVYGNKKKYKIYNIFLGNGYAVGLAPLYKSIF